MIEKIVDRLLPYAKRANVETDRKHWKMDITACHLNGTALDLEALYTAPELDFVHDVFGIRNYIDRASGKMLNHFLPRSSREELWTYEADGDLYEDGEFSTRGAAEEFADNEFAEQCQEDSPRNGETFSGELTLIRYHRDEEDEMVIDERIESALEYEHYHGDLAEHGTY